MFPNGQSNNRPRFWTRSWQQGRGGQKMVIKWNKLLSASTLRDLSTNIRPASKHGQYLDLSFRIDCRRSAYTTLLSPVAVSVPLFLLDSAEFPDWFPSVLGPRNGKSQWARSPCAKVQNVFLDDCCNLCQRTVLSPKRPNFLDLRILF